MKTRKELLTELLEYMQNGVTTEWGICACIVALDITNEEIDYLDEYIHSKLEENGIEPRYGLLNMYFWPMGDFEPRIEFVKQLIENEED